MPQWQIAAIKPLTGGAGADRAIDAVGVDAQHAHSGPAAEAAREHAAEFTGERSRVAPGQDPKDGN